MTSTFTTNKTLELPANGDYVNTWNIPVNSDMTVIDTALGGTTSLNATAGSATLTYTQYRPLILSVSGAVSANVTYTIPSGVGGQWIVRNAMTDSSGGPWDLIFASGGGGTSVIVSRGYTTTIYSDGTNISYSDSRLSTAAGSNRQIQYNNNGVLGASSTFVYDASGNVGIGTASPSTKTVINLTGGTSSYTNPLRLVNTAGGSSGCDIQFAGTYSATAPDTAFTAGSIGGLTTSGLSNGSGALIFKTQLNGTLSETMRIDASGNVGIGTASPSTKLFVQGASIGGDFAAISIDNNSGGSGTNTVSYNFSNGGSIKNSITGAVYGNGYLAFATNNNTEKMRIDASGNVGIGTASPAYKLDVQGGRAVVSPASEAFAVGIRYNASTNGVWLGSPSANAFQISSFTGTPYLNIDASGSVGIGTTSPNTKLEVRSSALTDSIRWTDNTNSTAFLGTIAAASTIYTNTSLAFGTGSATFSEKMRIDSSGNVGIGTASPSAKLDVPNGNIQCGNDIATGRYNIGSNGAYLTRYSSDGSIGLITAQGSLVFGTSATESMRIDAFGNLNIGAAGGGVGIFNSLAGSTAAGFFQNNGTTEIINISNSSNTAFTAMRFIVNAFTTVVGSISCSTSATAFNTSSDYRLKENVTPMSDGLATVSALNPVTYNWISDKSHGEGFIAHELAEIIPLAVTGEKDAVDKDGKIQPQGVDYSKVVVHLVAALQELSAKNDALEARLAKLENAQ